jgi:hypothetical protein
MRRDLTLANAGLIRPDVPGQFERVIGWPAERSRGKVSAIPQVDREIPAIHASIGRVHADQIKHISTFLKDLLATARFICGTGNETIKPITKGKP